jgi:SAM-dependent methyltransferase
MQREKTKAGAPAAGHEQLVAVEDDPNVGRASNANCYLLTCLSDCLCDLVQTEGYEADTEFIDNSQTAFSSSLRSSIYNYRYENGRTYHSFHDGQYPIPNDEAEQERLDLLHHLFKMMLGGELYTAPLPKEPRRILDIGTGTGIWAIEIADQLPMATVIGTDLSPIQPPWVPPNLQFYIDDAESEWLFRDFEKFDFIHGRALCGGIADWPAFYAQAFKSLKPGGWIEMQDHECWINSDDDSMSRAPWCAEWIREVDRASLKFGKRLNIAHLHRQWMIDTGFEDVHEHVHKVQPSYILTSKTRLSRTRFQSDPGQRIRN